MRPAFPYLYFAFNKSLLNLANCLKSKGFFTVTQYLFLFSKEKEHYRCENNQSATEQEKYYISSGYKVYDMRSVREDKRELEHS